MNYYEKRAHIERKGVVRSSTTIWSAAIALIVVVALILGLSTAAPSGYFYKAAIVAAILLLAVRQISRRLGSSAPRASQPDPKSAIKLG